MSNRQAILLLLALNICLVIFIFGDVIWHPNAYLFGISNDSIKNYFTFAWYVKYDSGLHFSGMNYPFGEHTFYTDNQPLFSFPLRLVQRYLFPIDNYIIGIINGITLISMPAAALVLYHILKKCLLPAWYAAIGATLIVLLSPQHYVMSYHYALANTLVLPSIWLCTIRLFENPAKISRHFWFNGVLLAAGLLHVYYLPIGLMLFAGHLLWLLVYQWQEKSLEWAGIAALALSGILPVIIFKLILYLTDQVADRPTDPIGFLEFKANLAGLLYPAESLTLTLLNKVFQLNKPTEANQGYIGLASIICLLLLGLKLIGYIRKRAFRKIVDPVLPRLMQMSLWASLPILIFAAAIPFRFGLMHWLNYLPIIKQFRFTYRFSWMFYYILGVYGIFVIYQTYHFLKSKNKQLLAYSWLGAMLLIWLADALILLRVEAPVLLTYKLGAAFSGEEDNLKTWLKTANRIPEDFQTIVPIPYYAHGSEKLDQFNSGSSLTMYQSMRAAYQTGIPLSNASLSRTSITYTLLHTQLLSSDSIKKELLSFLPSRKPILLVVTDSAEKKEEKRLLRKAKFLVKKKNISLYELSLDSLEKLFKTPAIPERTLKEIPTTVIYNTFTDDPSKEWLFQPGALTASSGPVIIFDNTIPFASDTINYESSIWVNARPSIGIPV